MKIKTIQKKGYEGKQAAIVVKYGGADFIHQLQDGSIVEMPAGIAHFLEHKMFEDPELNMFEEFTKLGASVNAYTHFTHTVYYFNTIDNFHESLELLLRLIEKPHFTDDNVEKEKGIILSEIDMYADNPFWQVYTGLHRALFLNSSLRHDILGTSESVRSISANQLSECHRHFYCPENMALICVGDFEESFRHPILNNLSDCMATTIQKSEPANAAASFIEKQMPVAMPIFQVGFKAVYDEIITPTTLAASGILADMLAGESSEIYSNLYDEGLIDNQFTAEYIGGTTYGIFLFSGMSPNPESVMDHILKAKLDENRFEIIKSKSIGRFMRAMNSIETISSIQADLFTRNQNIEDIIEALKTVTLNDVKTQFSNYMRKEACALSKVTPG